MRRQRDVCALRRAATLRNSLTPPTLVTHGVIAGTVGGRVAFLQIAPALERADAALSVPPVRRAAAAWPVGRRAGRGQVVVDGEFRRIAPENPPRRPRGER